MKVAILLLIIGSLVAANAAPSRQRDDPCGLPKVVGPCRMAIRVYYFNAATGTCTQFIYGGCGGNANRFATKKECKKRCEDSDTDTDEDEDQDRNEQI